MFRTIIKLIVVDMVSNMVSMEDCAEYVGILGARYQEHMKLQGEFTLPE